MINSLPAIIFVAKPPIIGESKTRLSIGVGDKNAIELYQAVLYTSAVELAKCLNVKKFICTYGHDEHLLFFKDLGFEVILTKSNVDLNEKIYGIFQSILSKHKSAVVLVGDNPMMTSEQISTTIIQHAISSLQKNKVVIGPTLDGGVYLIGISQGQLGVVNGLPYGRGELSIELCKKALQYSFEYEMLPKHIDLDTSKDIIKTLSITEKLNITLPDEIIQLMKKHVR